MREMKDIKKMINRANTLKEYKEQNSLSFFVVDDILDNSMYELSEEAIKDIKKNEKKGIAYFKDLQTSTLIEIAEV